VQRQLMHNHKAGRASAAAPSHAAHTWRTLAAQKESLTAAAACPRAGLPLRGHTYLAHSLATALAPLDVATAYNAWRASRTARSSLFNAPGLLVPASAQGSSRLNNSLPPHASLCGLLPVTRRRRAGGGTLAGLQAWASTTPALRKAALR